MKAIMTSVAGFMLWVALGLGEETYSSVDQAKGGKGAETFPPGLIKFEDADLNQVLNVYSELSGRTIVRSSALPTVKVSIRSQTSLTRIEALQALDSVLAQNGVIMIPQGTKFVKAVARQAAANESPPVVTRSREELPDCGTYITYIVEVKHQRPRDLSPGLQPFAAMPNSIVGVDHAGLLVLRDLSSNVRRMLEILERLDKAPADEKAEVKKRKAVKRKADKPSHDREKAAGD